MEPASEISKLLVSIESIETAKLGGRDRLGEEFNLEAAVPDIEKTVSVFRTIPRNKLDEIPDAYLDQIRQQCLKFMEFTQRVRDFSPSKQDNPAVIRLNLLAEAKGMHVETFGALFQFSAFLGSLQKSASDSEENTRRALAEISKNAEELQAALSEKEREASAILQTVRNVAAEQGVSQQAYYFKNCADSHALEAKRWQNYTVLTAVGLGIYAFSTLIFSLQFNPSTQMQGIQISVSKALIFATIAYMLSLCAKTQLSHRHNEIVNRHRENALMTFNALTSAAGSDGNRDIILNHAASCIFSPQDSGFSKAAQTSQPAIQVLDSLPKFAKVAGSES